tara:strand:+ start:219382 stop:219696 length:315 start_codon:yes stop_codon:yes gene_type:complete
MNNNRFRVLLKLATRLEVMCPDRVVSVLQDELELYEKGTTPPHLSDADLYDVDVHSNDGQGEIYLIAEVDSHLDQEDFLREVEFDFHEEYVISCKVESCTLIRK